VNDAASVAKSIVDLSGLTQTKHYLVPILPRMFQNFKNVKYLWNLSSWELARAISVRFGLTPHIHGGHLHEFALGLDRPYVLHLHGSDIRRFNEVGHLVPALNDRTIEAISKACLVFYSTPDLGPFVKPVRPDAVWLPNPSGAPILRQANNLKSSTSPKFADIFFPHAWTNAKGASRVIQLIQELRTSGLIENLRLRGLRMGDYQSEAREAGFTLVKPVNRQSHVFRMRESGIVLGQGVGMIGVTDLQAIFSGSNYIPFPLEVETMKAYGYHTNNQPSLSFDHTTALIREAINNNFSERNPRFLQKVLEIHSSSRIATILDASYGRI
jgi:hypothetical protein